MFKNKGEIKWFVQRFKRATKQIKHAYENKIFISCTKYRKTKIYNTIYMCVYAYTHTMYINIQIPREMYTWRLTHLNLQIDVILIFT